MKKIFYIQPTTYTKEIRTEKIVNSISKKYQTYILSPNNGGLPEFEKKNDINIIRMKNSINNKINYLKGLHFFLNPFWYNFIKKNIQKYSPDLIIVREVYIVNLVKMAIGNLDIPIILDMAECLPGEAKLKKRNIWDYIRRNYYYLSYIEKKALDISDKTFVVTKEQVSRLKNWEGQIEIISNYFDKQTQPYCDNPTKDLHPKSFVFNGRPNNLRGLDDIIRAAKILKKDKIDVKFYIVGGSKDKLTMENLRNKIKKYKLERYIEMTGWVDPAEMYSYMRGATFGVIPHKNCFAVNHTMPNKIFEFMMFGKPLIVSNALPLKRIVKKHNIGYIYESGNPKKLATIIENIYHNDISLNKTNSQIKDIAYKHYNWNNLERKILNIIREELK